MSDDAYYLGENINYLRKGNPELLDADAAQAVVAYFDSLDEKVYELLQARKKTDRRIASLEKALAPFAENPSEQMDAYTCHRGICATRECARCGKAIRAWEALHPA